MVDVWREKAKKTGDAELQVLLLHPMSEPAVSRGLREDTRSGGNFEQYWTTSLYQEVVRSCETILSWKTKQRPRISARLCKVASACFLLFINDLVFVEQYHFGTGARRASGRLPVYVFRRGPVYNQFEQHFRFVWDSGMSVPLTRDVLNAIEKPGDEEKAKLRSILEYSRPDLAPRSP